MKICLNDCLKLDAFRLSRVVACADELDRRVRSVSVFDEQDVDKGVERNGEEAQMVITHFWSIKDDIRRSLQDSARRASALLSYTSTRMASQKWMMKS